MDIIDRIITKTLNENIKKIFKENKATNYECINMHNSYASAMNEGSRGANGLKITFSESKTIFSSFKLNEGIDWEVENDKKGGIIVFSTDVNSVKQDDNTILDWLKKKMKTLINRVNVTKKIDKVAVNNNLVGWTVGRYLDGRYTGKDGKQYGENSLSVMVVGIDFDKLIKIAEELCSSFTQESVLVKDFETNRILFVKP